MWHPDGIYTHQRSWFNINVPETQQIYVMESGLLCKILSWSLFWVDRHLRVVCQAETQTVHPLKRCTTRKHRTVFCCSGWPLGHLQNGCLSEGPKWDLLPPKIKKQPWWRIRQRALERINIQEQSSPKKFCKAGWQLCFKHSTDFHISRPTLQPKPYRKKGLFQENCHFMQNKEALFSKQTHCFLLALKLGTRSFAVNSKIHGSAKDVSSKGPGFQTSKFESMVYLYSPAHTHKQVAWRNHCFFVFELVF